MCPAGHVNEKNFVGLSVSADGYIACGSEKNAVCVYTKALPSPMTCNNFEAGGDGQESASDAHQFVSSVCWSRQRNSMIAANSMGTIKALELV